MNLRCLDKKSNQKNAHPFKFIFKSVRECFAFQAKNMLPPANPVRGSHFWQPSARLITPKLSY